MKALTDESALWEAFSEGDRWAYGQLYDRYFDHLYRYGRKISADVSLVEDCIQDVFVNLWKNRQATNQIRHPKFYLFKVLRNQIVNHIRYQVTESFDYTAEDEYFSQQSLSREHFLIEQEIEKSREESLKLAIKKLTNREREVVFLKFYQDLSADDISRIMEISVPAVYNLTSKAILKLKQCLDTFFIVALLLSHRM